MKTKTKIKSKFHGVVEIGVDQSGIPALRLVAYHCPGLRVEVTRSAITFLIPLTDLSFEHSSLAELNAHPHVPTVSFVGEFDANGGPPAHDVIQTPDHAESGVRPWPREHTRG